MSCCASSAAAWADTSVAPALDRGRGPDRATGRGRERPRRGSGGPRGMTWPRGYQAGHHCTAMTLQLPDDLDAKLTERARRERRTKQELAVEAIRDAPESGRAMSHAAREGGGIAALRRPRSRAERRQRAHCLACHARLPAVQRRKRRQVPPPVSIAARSSRKSRRTTSMCRSRQSACRPGSPFADVRRREVRSGTRIRERCRLLAACRTDFRVRLCDAAFRSVLGR